MVEQIKCGQCALWQPDTQICRLSKQARTSENSCPEGTTLMYKCDLCGREVLPRYAIIDIGLDHKTHIICSICNENYYNCITCAQSSMCDFESNPIDLPKQISKEMKTEQGYFVTSIRNPSRIEKTCKVNCDCFDEENGCLRQINYCKNHSIKWKI